MVWHVNSSEKVCIYRCVYVCDFGKENGDDESESCTLISILSFIETFLSRH